MCSVPGLRGFEVNGLVTMASKIMSTLRPLAPFCVPVSRLVPQKWSPRQALEALDKFDPTAASTTAADATQTASAARPETTPALGGQGAIEDESSLEDGTIVNMQVRVE